MNGNDKGFVTTYSIVDAPAHATYDALIDWAVSHCPLALVVVQSTMPLSDDGRDALSQLEPHLVRREMSSEWPGTRLLGREAEVLYYRTNDMFGNALKHLARSLFAWQQPDRPEDLCFLRADASAVLASIAHESQAFMSLRDDELVTLRAQVPNLELIPD